MNFLLMKDEVAIVIVKIKYYICIIYFTKLFWLTPSSSNIVKGCYGDNYCQLKGKPLHHFEKKFVSIWLLKIGPLMAIIDASRFFRCR